MVSMSSRTLYGMGAGVNLDLMYSALYVSVALCVAVGVIVSRRLYQKFICVI